jgi:hypothetical protein
LALTVFAANLVAALAARREAAAAAASRSIGAAQE